MNKKWLIGCGCGCAIPIILVLLVVLPGILFVKDTSGAAREMKETAKLLQERFGEPTDYVPPPIGLSSQRLAIFLEVRATTSETVAEIERRMSELNVDGLDDPGVMEVLAVLKSMQGLFFKGMSYLSHRNRVLLEKDMSVGEYSYIYSIIYHSWLKNRVNHGPTIKMEGRKEEVMGEDAGEFSPSQVAARYRDFMLQVVSNQLEGIPEDMDPSVGAHLSGELERLRDEPDYVLFQDHFPAEMAELLEPHRELLTKGWSPTLNRFEVGLVEGEKGFNINF